MKRRYIEINGVYEEYCDYTQIWKKRAANIVGYTKHIFADTLRVPTKIFKGSHIIKTNNKTDHKCYDKNSYLDYDCVYGQMNN